MHVEVSSSASEDLRSAVVYYSGQGSTLATAFLDEFDRGCTLISESPKIGTPTGDRNRKLVLQRFPFSVIYRVETDRIFIFAVSHQRRHPKFWHSRR
ncbi:MAG: hypothetical protein BMS9Abin05_2678 [Rhodothermia bacterium]|nr:MAG: hypothetical protein BMS9Abin05_2678 [Rhodothermia bacterium]